ncbi:MAG: tetratricopeptide repeat protein [Sandaracinaceae bacterium]
MTAGTAGSSNLDTRLLRFRSKAGGEDAVALVEDLLASGRAADAKDVAATALKASPDDGMLLVMDGRARFAAGDLLGAQAALLKAARVAPKDKRPFRFLGEVLLKRGDPQRAIKVLQRAEALDATDPDVRRLLERATRLDRIAATADDPEPAAPLPPPPARARAAPPDEAGPPAERTVIRADLTEQLRSLTAESRAAAGDTEEGEAVTTTAGRAYEDNAGAVFSAVFEDEPTNLMSGPPGRIEPPPPALPRKKPGIRSTMAFGSARDASNLGDTDDESTAVERPPRPGQPIKPPARTATSPGATKAPIPPPPKRRLPSEAPRNEASASPAGEPAPWSQIDDPFAPPAAASKAPPAPAANPVASGGPSGRMAARPAPRSRDDDPFFGEAFPAAPEPSPPRADPFAPALDDGDVSPVDADLASPERLGGPGAAAFDDDLPESAHGATARRHEDVQTGGAGAEDVDAILRMLRDQGLFEPSSADPQAQWAGRADVRQTQTSGTRIGLWMGVAWVLAMGLAAGGWFGWQEWVKRKHAQAAELVTQANAEALDGTHEALVDAERHLREARDLNVHDREGPALMLVVHSQRALEDGAFDAGFLRPTIAFAEQMDDERIAAYLDLARAVLAAAEGGTENARTRLAAALEARPEDAFVLYLVGRLEQRLGAEEALEHLRAASEAEAALNAPRIALAEARFDEGQAEDALSLLDQVLANHSDHLRAQLWRAYMTSDSEEPEAALRTLTAFDEDVEQHGAPTDRVLFELARSRLLRRNGSADQAREAVDEAMRAGASEPRLLALLATEGRRAGRLAASEMAAQGAVTGAPTNPDFRKLLAEIQLARRNGRAALTTLSEMSSEDPDVIEMRAQAALLLGSDEALAAASEGLDAYVTNNPDDASVRVRALRIRIHTLLGQAREMIPEARALLEQAPGDPDAALALGEAALRLFDADTAVEALEQVTAGSPDDAEGFYLLGRAKRMASDGEGAERALRRAVELSPDHTDAKLTRASLQVDLGDYEAATEVDGELARGALGQSNSQNAIAGRLGRAEALMGLGRLDDAEVQIEGLTDGARETPSARMTTARLRLLQGRSGDALRELRPLTEEAAGPSATVMALYGDALLAARQVGPASDAYAAALELDDGSPEAMIGQADMAVRSDRGRDALEVLDRLDRMFARRIRPPAMHARALVLRGRAHLLNRDEGAAATALRHAIETNAAPAEAHFWLGEALSSDDSAEARSAYERYLALDGEGPYAARARRAIR